MNDKVDAGDDDPMSDYTEFCPKGGDGEWFNTASNKIVDAYKLAKPPARPRKIDRELQRVRSALKDLSTEARAELASREINLWQKDRPEETSFDDAYFGKSRKLKDGGSAVTLLEKIVAATFQRDKQRTAIKRRDLIARAAYIFSTFGGSIEATERSPFVNYLQEVFIDTGLELADCPKAVRDFLAKYDGVLDK